MATFLHLAGLFIYIILAAIIPAEPGKRSVFETCVDAVGAAFESVRQRPVTSAAGNSAGMSTQDVTGQPCSTDLQSESPAHPQT
jgi:hypothetical protein